MSNDYFDAGDWTRFAANTLVRANALNQVIDAIVAGFDLIPDQTAVKEGRVTYAVAGGTANALTATLSGIGAYTDGLCLHVKTPSDNTGAATINLNAIGAKSIKRATGADLAAGDLVADGVAILIYDGSNFRLASMNASEAAAAEAAAVSAAASASAASISASAASASATAAAGSASSAATSAASASASAASAAAAVGTTTGTGNLVRAGSPTFTGTVGAANITATGTISCAIINSSGDAGLNGNVTVGTLTSGNYVRANGFGITMQMDFSGINSSGGAGSNIDCIAQGSGGVRLAGGATSWASISDETLKTEFTPFTGALAKVASIKSGTGRYLTDDPGMSRSFLSAQAVQAVLPEAVTVRTSFGEVEDPMAGKLMLSYQDVIPLLVAALKEANDRIVALESAP